MEGRLFWVTGLSGAGKTTIGTILYKKLKERHPNTVLFDGDTLRQVFGNDLGYSREDRFACAMRYARLCKLLTEQGIFVVCCTISMFDDVRKWNRENISDYSEIYIKVPIEVLEKRNQKNLYHDVKKGTAENVVGMDLELELPENSDFILVNDGVKSPEEMGEELWGAICAVN
ncbi:MAG: adenylyl-sulfate kinase [Lachnospiraceae bacterium]|nr:adenylyl-sulfate kinase [Lachnospiraceae bacterium]